MKNNKEVETEKSKKRPGIKSLDVVIILLILLSIVGIYFRFNVMDKLTLGRNLKDCTVSFEIKNIRYTTETYMEVGDKVFFSDSGEALGTLIKPEKDASDEENKALRHTNAATTVTVYDKDGNRSVEEVRYPDNTFIDARGRMNCKGTYSEEKGFLLNGVKPITPGDKIEIKTERVTVSIIITDITLAES